MRPASLLSPVLVFAFGVLTPTHLALAQAAVTSQPGPPASVQDRSQQLAALFQQMWEAGLKRSPEFASSLGDRRYNDQLSDLSAINLEQQQNHEYLLQLEQIDTTGLTAQEKLSAQLMQRQLVMDEEGARFKEWEMPVNQFHGIHTDLPSEVSDWPFETVKDYDDYIARLHRMPAQLRQASTTTAPSPPT
jgi:uncharacterized protein (DUF885 family)